MKKFILSFILMMLVFTSVVNANSINSITMDIYIDANGDAQVTEVWNCRTNQGTESYHPYYNLGNSKITDLLVEDEDGVIYTTLSSWNVNGSFENKKYKCGINKISDGVELCWGISEYGNKTYTVRYEIINFVKELTDSQIAYWTLIPHDFSNRIENAELTIYADEKFEDTLDVWGYGDYGAPTYVYDGQVKMHSNNAIDADEYMVVLVKFPQGTFNTSNVENNDFQYYLDMAEEGATHYESTEGNSISAGAFVGFGLMGLLAFFIECIPVIFILGLVVFLNAKSEFVKVTPEQKAMIKDAPYYRDIPCDKDLFKMFYIAQTTGLLKRKTDIMGAVILKWLKEKKISIIKEEKGLLNREQISVVFNREAKTQIEDHYESSLYSLMYTASRDGTLEKKELERWCSSNYSTILSWFDRVLIDEKNKLLQSNELYRAEEGKYLKKKRIYFSDLLVQEAMQIQGLKKYLNDYTLISEREPIEVILFEDYLIVAQMLGIADKVIKDFKNLYPEIIEASSFQSYDNIVFLSTTMNRGITSAQSAKSRAESYSSGGGGFSSGGGGGGSSGGGGGGGGFR